ncbi:MAG: hypothetical protein G4V63_09180 [Candidatus Afipia apatlaquensis]|uniref:Uncharacterized protein n=1 Tax=Candidatus Afipia apatlaquensis TaxID=2712852 RepID=A0A7C9RF98_9BRAD|nr:hypothetical protein [Candidatus Afipia apatlaquensis]
MSYFRPSNERERVTKRFLTAREVEDMAAAGAVEIVHVDGLVITDAARETADDLGLRITKPQQPAVKDSRTAERSPQPAERQSFDGNTGTAPGGRHASEKAASAAAPPVMSQSRGAMSADPLLQALVQAVRSNRAKLSALAQGE